MLFRFLLIGLIGLAPASCESEKSASAVDSPPMQHESYRAEVFRNLYSQDTLLVVAGGTVDQQQFSEQWLRRGPFGRRGSAAVFDLNQAALVSEAQLGEGALVLAGTYASNPWLAQLPASFPASFDENGFTFGGVRYDAPSHAVLITHPNPYNPAFPLFLAALLTSAPASRSSLTTLTLPIEDATSSPST